MSVKVVKEKRCKSQYTRVRVKENLDKNGNCVEMLMRKGWRESKPLWGKWKVPTEAWGSRKQGAVMGEVEGEKSGRCGQRGCNVFLKHRSFSQKRGRFSEKRWTFSGKRRRFSGISRKFLRRRSEGDKRKQRWEVCAVAQEYLCHAQRQVSRWAQKQEGCMEWSRWWVANNRRNQAKKSFWKIDMAKKARIVGSITENCYFCVANKNNK